MITHGSVAYSNMLLGVQEILCFFTHHCNPSLAYIAVRDIQSSLRNASVQSLPLAGNFLYNQKQPSTGEGEVANFLELLEKTQYLINAFHTYTILAILYNL